MSSKIKKPALFLDRDGIINVDNGYVYKIEDFFFNKGIFDLIKLFKNRGYYIFIVTNQSGIGRGYYSLNDFKTLTNYMLSEFKKEEISIDKVEFCPHSPESNCNCRKPKTGMVERILSEFDVDLSKSWMVGDKQSDIDLAKNAKIGVSVAIGDGNFSNASYNFKTIQEFLKFLEKNLEDI